MIFFCIHENNGVILQKKKKSQIKKIETLDYKQVCFPHLFWRLKVTEKEILFEIKNLKFSLTVVSISFAHYIWQKRQCQGLVCLFQWDTGSKPIKQILYMC